MSLNEHLIGLVKEIMLCSNGYVLTGRVSLISGASGIIESLKNKITDLVTSDIGGDMAASPWGKCDELERASVIVGVMFTPPMPLTDSSTGYKPPYHTFVRETPAL